MKDGYIMRKINAMHLWAVILFICNECVCVRVKFVEPVTLCKKVAYHKDVIICMIDSREAYLG